MCTGQSHALLDEGEGVDRPSEMMVWLPDGPELLEGTFHLEGGLNWTIRTKDGAMWLLESEAARELESLGPDEGQSVRVTFNGSGESAYEVDLL
jgi:hypothetical protein